jgi:phosphoribosyl-ATP pyrophosphohydrolase
MNGNAVQLIGGKEKAIDAGDPLPIAASFGLAGEVAVIDLDAALGNGSNRETISRLVRETRCRVGGGIRDLETARFWLDSGASKIIIGTKAEPALLRELPKTRLIAALDAYDGEVVVEGWTSKTGKGIHERMHELRDYVDGFLVTFVEKEGRLQGTNLDQVRSLVESAGSARVTIAGGVSSVEDIRLLDEMGADAQVGMALYTGKISLGDAIAAPLTSDRADGLWPTVVCDQFGVALGLAWSNAESLREAVDSRSGVYHSRKRGLWKKGSSSGATQELLGIDLDCDRDALRFRVRQQAPGFCHNETFTCWGESGGLLGLERTLTERKQSAPPGSYVQRLFTENGLLDAKLLEEMQEFVDASSNSELIGEAADVLFFTMTRLVEQGISLDEVGRELDRRALKISRRPGNRKDV